MLRKLKILIITPIIPYPPYRGDKLRIYNVIKTLIKKHDVKVLSFLKDKNELNFVSELKKLGIDVELIKFPKLKAYLRLILAFFTKTPLQVIFYYNKKLMQRIYELTSNENYDIAYFHIFTTMQYHNAVNNPQTLKVIDLTDAYSLYLKRILEFEQSILNRIFFTIEKKRVYEYEKISKYFDTVFVCSKIDKEFLQQRNIHANIQLFENGIDTNIYKYEEIIPEKHRIIFTGNLPYFPNRDAVKYFVNEIFPYVLQKVPDAKLYIVGKDPTQDIMDLSSKNVIVKGFVEDLKYEYLVSEVNIAPMRFGAGTANKIIEAIALGVPTVATSLAVKGFDENVKKYVFEADTPENFANKIIEIFNDNSIRTNFMKEASKTVSYLLNLDTVIGRIENYLFERKKNKRESNYN